MIQGAVTEERPIQIEQPRVWPRYFWVVNYMPHYHVPETHGSMAFVLNCDASSGVCDLEVLHRNGAWERIRGVRYRGTADYEKFPETREQPCWEWADTYPQWLMEMVIGGSGPGPAPEMPVIEMGALKDEMREEIRREVRGMMNEKPGFDKDSFLKELETNEDFRKRIAGLTAKK